MDTLVRERTLADRKSFVLSEMAIETANSLASANKVEEVQPIDTSVAVDPAWAERRSAAALREATVKFKHDMFMAVMGETVYRAIPFDEHEKARFHESVIDSVTEMIKHTGSWNLTEGGTEIADCISQLVEEKGIDQTLADIIANESLTEVVNSIANTIEGRVVSAMVSVRAKAASAEYELATIHEECAGDTELLEMRKRRLQKGSPTSLIESLYAATTRTLTESTGSETIPQEIIMAEAVTLYTMMETLSAVGIMEMTNEEVMLISKTLLANK